MMIEVIENPIIKWYRREWMIMEASLKIKTRVLLLATTGKGPILNSEELPANA